ncbi:uncharacterized protein LOC126780047 isoform X2 [Nymphalis io]|uniref:uncharacterized protein LOC126780047 isoform X2 n=1 Tax=Inachis io TaxID=171585 RepID=UPI0021697F5C|nr:uncharacterized protein LOC126780047 isoform X2 [Nymphalis io]
MARTVALVIMILQITSSRCRNIDTTNKHLDDASPVVAEHFVPDTSFEGHYQDQFNELKKYLKIIPFKGNGDLKNNTIFPSDYEGDIDFPIAVILASHLEENMRDDLKHININDYLTEIIKNSYKFDRNKDVKTETEKHSELAINKGEDEDILKPEEIKLDNVKYKPTINDKITDLESTASNNDIDIKNILNNSNIKPKVHTNIKTKVLTNLNKSMENDDNIESVHTNSEDVTPDNHSHKNVSNTKGVRNKNETKTDNHRTLQTDEDLTVNDLIKSIHHFDTHSEQSDTDRGHLINKTFEVISPEYHRMLRHKGFNRTNEDFLQNNYILKFVFNL